jgi:hypothetical protein
MFGWLFSTTPTHIKRGCSLLTTRGIQVTRDYFKICATQWSLGDFCGTAAYNHLLLAYYFQDKNTRAPNTKMTQI